MASFKIHEDQENQLANIGRLKNSQQPNSNHGQGLGTQQPQRRTALGDINSNSNANRICTRSSKQREQKQQNENACGKGKDLFVVHEDVPEATKPAAAASAADVPSASSTAAEPEKKKKDAQKKPSENKLDLSDAMISVPRQPLKDLKELRDEDAETVSDEAMSESYASGVEESPMSLESFRISSPLVRNSKPSYQVLYDLDDYRRDIYQYLIDSQSRQRPKALYMRRQPDVTYSMRSILVDWLVEVAEEYKLHTETLYLGVSFVDRFLSYMSVVKGKLQLLGTTAMFLAAKYEEIYPPEVSEFVYITDDTYSKKQVLRMEQLILKVLGFDLSVPTVYTFLQHVAVDCNLSVRLKDLAQYLCELTLLEGDPYLAFLPSIVACSALAVARNCLEYDDVWSEELVKSTGYSLAELAPCIAHFNTTHAKAEAHPQQAIYDKYKSQRFHKVADIKPKMLIIV